MPSPKFFMFAGLLLLCLLKETNAFVAITRLLFRSDPRAATVGSGIDSTSASLPRIIQTKGVPIHLYTSDIDGKALDQLKVLAESPIPTDYVSAMPDVHLGKGVTIGSVFASEDYVSPNAVGVDIGCGMAAVPIDGLFKHQLKPDDMNQIQQLLKEQIPTGFNDHASILAGTVQVLDEITSEVEPTKYLSEKLLGTKVGRQLGTLGGGKQATDFLSSLIIHSLTPFCLQATIF